MKAAVIAILGFSLLLVLAAANAVDEHGQLEDPVLQSRYEKLTKELRCLVCQNESVADSNAFLARDLRTQVQEMLTAGKSDDEILNFMTDRYGEFVRYSPPLDGKTVLLWGAPFFMLALGVVVIWRITRRRASMPLDDDPAPNT